MADVSGGRPGNRPLEHRAMSQFKVGQRVIAAHCDLWLNGYYGHVSNVYPDMKPCYPTVDVVFMGRIGGSFDPTEVGVGPYPMFPRELEHAD